MPANTVIVFTLKVNKTRQNFRLRAFRRAGKRVRRFAIDAQRQDELWIWFPSRKIASSPSEKCIHKYLIYKYLMSNVFL